MLYMKTLIDHTILYDDECPLCREYTNAFVKTGMLDQHGREAFTNVVNSNIPNIDWNRARNEIALINKKDNSVQYGIDSLMTILSNSMPGLKRLFRFKPFYFLMNQFYFFISYNRKAIAPAKVFEGNSTCAPDLNYTYRWAYIIFTWLVTSFILVQYSTLVFPLIPRSDFYREFLICGGQLVFQGVIVATIKRDRWIHYLGNVMTISFMGALALAPMFLPPLHLARRCKPVPIHPNFGSMRHPLPYIAIPSIKKWMSTQARSAPGSRWMCANSGSVPSISLN
jgi:predicted DCC family thiol-disulfide oxidoreductase YuxK